MPKLEFDDFLFRLWLTGVPFSEGLSGVQLIARLDTEIYLIRLLSQVQILGEGHSR